MLARERHFAWHALAARMTPTASGLSIILAELADHAGNLPPLTYPQIMAQARIGSRGTLTRALAQLERNGLLAKTGNARNRRYIILWPRHDDRPIIDDIPIPTLTPRRHLRAV